MTCPDCGADCDRDEVDGQGGGRWGCPECHWIEGTPPMIGDHEPERKWPPLPFFRCDCGYPAETAMMMIAHQRGKH